MIEKENIHVDVNGVWFNGKHSWRDFGMFLAERPDTGTPEPKVVTVEIPGADGVLDFSEAAAGYVKYNNRQMTFTFSAMVDAADHEKFKAKIRNAIHGKNVEVELDEDSGWIYNGRASVSFNGIASWKLQIVVTVDAYPYKLSKKFKTVRLNLPALSGSWGTGEAVSWELTHEPVPYGSMQTIFKLTRSFYPSHLTFPNNSIDLASFGGMTLKWDASKTPYATATLALTDTTDTTFTTEIDATAGSWTAVDLTRFFPGGALARAAKFEVDGIPNCRVFLSEGIQSLSRTHAQTIVDVGDMPVVPIIHQNCDQGFQLWANSTTLFTVVDDTEGVTPVPYPPALGLVLLPGKNEVIAAWRLPAYEYNGTEGKFCELIFREGRL